MKIDDGRKRVIIEGVEPEIDAGRFPAKRIVGETISVFADIFVDGHDLVTGVVRYRHEAEEQWQEAPLFSLPNDRWRGELVAPELGRVWFTFEAWVDHFGSWRRDFGKRLASGENLDVQYRIGAAMLEEAAGRASGDDRKRLMEAAHALEDDQHRASAADLILGRELEKLMQQYPDRRLATRYVREVPLLIERPRARFSSWYELFPRSFGEDGTHGTLADVERMLPYVAGMGFDVLYLPPIHPIGESYRKGRNNSPTAEPGEVGSPWAIGGREGGHTSVHPELGTVDDLRRLVEAASSRGIELALDIAFQASPDHPIVEEHPDFFLWRPDGTVQYAENPPKKYQDIYPFNFETAAWQELWRELREVFLFWAGHGVRIFRVDNPHTKPLPFWEWVISEVRGEYPDAIFLSEAFTRPKLMNYLAKAGFSQSYTYFTWRNTKVELTDYFTQLTRTEMREFFRPNAWPNTPDILPESLQIGGRAAFVSRLVLAATLSSNYGIYGPAYELMEHEPRVPGAEEYLNSEKYEIKQWNIEDERSLRHVIARVNRIRHENEALHSNDTLYFHPTDNDQIICYSKSDPKRENLIVTVVSLDPYSEQSGWIDLHLDELELDGTRPYQAHDLLGGGRFLWHGGRNLVHFEPGITPAHVFRIRRRLRTEHDFEYFL
jgi:starch synthase (maltosyl-transferring)